MVDCSLIASNLRHQYRRNTAIIGLHQYAGAMSVSVSAWHAPIGHIGLYPLVDCRSKANLRSETNRQTFNFLYKRYIRGANNN